jgi:hypothetical protein
MAVDLLQLGHPLGGQNERANRLRQRRVSLKKSETCNEAERSLTGDGNH